MWLGLTDRPDMTIAFSLDVGVVGGAMVLGKLSVPRRPTNLDNRMTRTSSRFGRLPNID